jgi:hypothetical protein
VAFDAAGGLERARASHRVLTGHGLGPGRGREHKERYDRQQERRQGMGHRQSFLGTASYGR